MAIRPPRMARIFPMREPPSQKVNEIVADYIKRESQYATEANGPAWKQKPERPRPDGQRAPAWTGWDHFLRMNKKSRRGGARMTVFQRRYARPSIVVLAMAFLGLS